MYLLLLLISLVYSHSLTDFYKNLVGNAVYTCDNIQLFSIGIIHDNVFYVKKQHYPIYPYHLRHIVNNEKGSVIFNKQRNEYMENVKLINNHKNVNKFLFKKNNNNIYALVEGITNYYHKQAMSTIGSLSQEPNIKQIIDEIRDNYNTDVYMIFGYYKFSKHLVIRHDKKKYDDIIYVINDKYIVAKNKSLYKKTTNCKNYVNLLKIMKSS